MGQQENAGHVRAIVAGLRGALGHLAMEWAVLTEGRAPGDVRVVAHADAGPPGAGDPAALAAAAVALCADPARRLVADPEAAAPIRAALIRPMFRPDGSVFGALGCFSCRPRADLCPKDLTLLDILAERVQRHVTRHLLQTAARHQAAERLRTASERGGPPARFAATRCLARGDLLGLMPLADTAGPVQGIGGLWDPRLGALSVARDLARAAAALDLVPQVPEGVSLTLPLSLEAVLSERLPVLLANRAAPRLVLSLLGDPETVEQSALLARVEALRRQDLRFAVTADTEMGLDLAFRLGPDQIRLPAWRVRDLAHRPSQRGHVAGVVHLAREMSCDVIAEGLACDRARDTLLALGVRQGEQAAPGDTLTPQEIASLRPVPRPPKRRRGRPRLAKAA